MTGPSSTLSPSGASALGRALRGAEAGLWDWSLDQDVVCLCDRAAATLGLSVGSNPVDSWLDRVHPLDLPRFLQDIASVLDGETEGIRAEYRHVDSAGACRWVQVHGRVVGEGGPSHISGTVLDLSDPRQHDSLTGLPNRHMLLARLGQLAAVARSAALICLGIDHLDRVSEVYGHPAGAAIERSVAGRLSACLREEHGVRLPATMEHTVAALGGGEFVVLCRHVDRLEDLQDIARQLQDGVAGTVPVGSWRMRTSVSVGIRMADTGRGAPAELIRDARVALQAARTQPVDRRQVFDAAMHEKATRRMEMEGALADALQREEFSLAFQPVLELSGERCVGVECLVRWDSPAWGWVSPVEFIPAAEATGLIVPLGEWILRTACARAAVWRREHGLDLHVAVNVSTLQLRQVGFADRVAAALDETGLAVEGLQLEVTESAFIDDMDTALPVLRRLRDMGITLLLDDFGTGYSSLAYLLDLPIDCLKIDRAFVNDMHTDHKALALTRSIVAMARSLGLSTVAEGIETPDHASELRRLGCDLVQGYFYSRPLFENDLLDWIRRRAAEAA